MNDGKQVGLPKDLGDGLTLRWATPADIEALADFNIRIQSDNPEEPETWLGHWVRDLMNWIMLLPIVMLMKKRPFCCPFSSPNDTQT